jgi:hypothetical protein
MPGDAYKLHLTRPKWWHCQVDQETLVKFLQRVYAQAAEHMIRDDRVASTPQKGKAGVHEERGKWMRTDSECKFI